jgi:hypothetical protein
MGNVPEHIMEQARDLAHTLSTPMAHWEMSDLLAAHLLAAEKRGREEAAKIAETYDPRGKLKHRGTCEGITAAIRSGQ